MTITQNLKQAICSLFEVHHDEGGVQRIVTPLEYVGTNDRVVVRVRPLLGNQGYSIDENGDAAFYASLNGGDVEADVVERWAGELTQLTPVCFSDDETLTAFTNDERLIGPYVFRVAEAAQQLHAIATARVERQSSDFKDRIKEIIQEIAREAKIKYESDVDLPIAGGLKADHVLGDATPLIIVAATSSTRLLEAEVIHMQYRAENMPGYILAVAESQAAVGKKQFERASYYTNKTVVFDINAFGKLISNEVRNLH